METARLVLGVHLEDAVQAMGGVGMARTTIAGCLGDVSRSLDPAAED